MASSNASLVSAATKTIPSPKYLVISPSGIKVSQSFFKCPTFIVPGISLAVRTATTPG